MVPSAQAPILPGKQSALHLGGEFQVLLERAALERRIVEFVRRGDAAISAAVTPRPS